MKQPISHIKKSTAGQYLQSVNPHSIISNVVYDTRKISYPQSSIFVALSGKNNDGHKYLDQAYKKGIRSFLVSKKIDPALFPDANIILCEDTLIALQIWATAYRTTLDYPIVVVVGSNGKTITKEWLAQALQSKMKVGKSPLSYNSQLGVALSLLSLAEDNDLGIIEAGISEMNEMDRLQQMVRPNIGIFTNIGEAHKSGFPSLEVKLHEKLMMLQNCQTIIFNRDATLINREIEKLDNHSLSWGLHPESDIQLFPSDQNEKEIKFKYKDQQGHINFPFASSQLKENAMHVIAFLLLKKWQTEDIQSLISQLSPLPNRLELKEGINNTLLINDSYSSDLTSMRMALEQMDQIDTNSEKVLILSRMEEQGEDDLTYRKLTRLINEKGISKVIAIGIPDAKLDISPQTIYYNSADECIESGILSTLRDSTILIKGARSYKLERIYDLMSRQVHQTSLETDLTAVRHNINIYKSLLKPATKLMAVVKAEAYGSGSIQMVNFLREQRVDYLAVALIDEGVTLRQRGCDIPIMTFNIQEGDLDHLWAYDLEPEVYSFHILGQLIQTALRHDKVLKIHIKVDTGMHRLGFLESELPILIDQLRAAPIAIASIFSHLSASDTEALDTFTKAQFDSYNRSYDIITKGLQLSIPPLRHILNSAGIVRFHEHQYDMVRLGLGLYGIDTSDQISNQLMLAHRLTAKVIQIKQLPEGKTTGYNRSGKATEDTEIGIISIGYGDGLMRLIGNGQFQVQIQGKLYPTLGNICMDVTIVDLGINHGVSVGDEVVLFSPNYPISKLSDACKTIPYEILSRLAPRVKRTYIYR